MKPSTILENELLVLRMMPIMLLQHRTSLRSDPTVYALLDFEYSDAYVLLDAYRESYATCMCGRI